MGFLKNFFDIGLIMGHRFAFAFIGLLAGCCLLECSSEVKKMKQIIWLGKKRGSGKGGAGLCSPVTVNRRCRNSTKPGEVQTGHKQKFLYCEGDQSLEQAC